MNKFDLIEAVVAETGMSRKEVETIVEKALDLIGDNLVKGEIVKLTDFGTFSLKVRQARNGTNPKTSEKIRIPEAKTIGFKASKKLKARL